MRRHRKQFANTNIFTAVLIAAIAPALIAPPLLARAQAPSAAIDPKLLALADAGDPKSQLLVGFAYERSEGGTLDPAQAPVWYRKAAESGDATAQFILGWENCQGLGVPKDEAQADAWFRKAGEHAYSISQALALKYPPFEELGEILKPGIGQEFFYIGDNYEEGKDLPQNYAQAAFWYREGAKQGDPDAQSSLGVLYSEGKGVQQDYVLAAAWFRRAADQGYADAESNLGSLYLDGRGVPQDFKEAKQWFEKASNQGSAGALYNLGLIYAKGQGVPQSNTGAYLCFDLAAARLTGPDQVNAEKVRDLAASLLTPEELSKAQEAAEKWFAEHPVRR